MSYSVQYRPRTRAGRIEVRRDAAVQPPARALHRRADALVFDVLAGLRALQDRAQERGDVGGHHLERRLAVDLVLRLAHRVGERLVHERVASRLRSRYAIGPGMLSANRRICASCALQRVADADVVLDVGHHGERAADAAAQLAVGEQRDARPARIAFDLALAPLVRHRRAGERAVDVPLHLARTSPPAARPSARGRARRRPARRSSCRTACWRSGCLSWRSK